MAMETIFPCNSKHHGLLQWKCVLPCCYKFPSIVLPSQEENKYTTNTCPTIRFHVNCIISRYIVHGLRTYHKHKLCSLCSTVPISYSTEKLYTQKELVLLETSVTEFHENLYISAIKKLVFNFPHVRILGTHRCGK